MKNENVVKQGENHTVTFKTTIYDTTKLDIAISSIKQVR